MKLTFAQYVPFIARLASATSFYFDGSLSINGDGSQSKPFNTLAGIPSLALKPGDNILLKKGSKFGQTLHVTKSGTAQSPITIGSYGSDTAGAPVVQCPAAGINSVLLEGVEHVTLQDLEITNPGDNTTVRRGVYVYAKDKGAVAGITLQRLYIHDVTGRTPSTVTGLATGKYANATGGIVIEAQGNTTGTYFTGLTIADNLLVNVARQGIYTWSNWCRRPELASFWNSLCSATWYASTGFTVKNNRLVNVAGDGIVITGNEDAKTVDNLIQGFHHGGGGNSAGIWTANSVGSYFAYNDVSGGQSTGDGMSYDVDHSTSGTVFEYNLSHDNEGGFFLLCPYDKPTTNFTIRYNLSVNDRARIFQVCPGNLVGGEIYKNTILIGNGIAQQVVTAPTGKNLSLDVQFTDNIVKTVGSGTGHWTLDSPEFVIDNNVFHGAIDSFPGATDSITNPPGLAAPGLRDPYAYLLLNSNASALDAAVSIAGDATEDFFGNSVNHKNIGFYGGAGTKVPQWISSFDTGTLSPWTFNTASIVADPSGNLGKSVLLTAGGSLVRSFSASSTGLRFNARLWFGGVSSTAAATVQVGGIKVTFNNLTTTQVGWWQILVVEIASDGTATATLGSHASTSSWPVSSVTSSGNVVISAGANSLYVDDVFITSL